MAQWVKNPPAMQETQEIQVQSLGWDDPLEEEMATHASILAWHRGECQHTRFKLDTVLQGETGRSLNCTVTPALMCTLHVSLPQMCSLTLPEYSLNPFNISLLSFFGFFFFFTL